MPGDNGQENPNKRPVSGQPYPGDKTEYYNGMTGEPNTFDPNDAHRIDWSKAPTRQMPAVSPSNAPTQPMSAAVDVYNSPTVPMPAVSEEPTQIAPRLNLPSQGPGHGLLSRQGPPEGADAPTQPLPVPQKK